MAGTHIVPGSGPSGFAGGNRGAGLPNGSVGNKTGSDADSEKLGISTSSDNGSSANGGGPGSGGSAGSGSSGNGNATDAIGQDKKKWSFGALASGVGSMFGGGRNAAKGSSANGNLSSRSDEALKRKIASDKFASEITSASGKSNWEKVHGAYSIKENTLIPGQ